MKGAEADRLREQRRLETALGQRRTTMNVEANERVKPRRTLKRLSRSLRDDTDTPRLGL